MREIKFRVWDKERKVFRYPALWDNSMPSNWMKFDVLQQFTGFKDKNGKEIYEGDLIKSPFFDAIVPVIWDQQFAQFTFGGAEFNVEIKPENIEVLGNIFETPELLTQ